MKPTRKVYLDYLRLIATLFVICGHTISLAESLVEQESVAHRVLELAFFLFPSCNLLFVMISGALLLPMRDERVGAFFCRRFVKVLVPMLVYYFLYVCAKYGLACLLPGNLPFMFQRLVAGAADEVPHFWLVFVILQLYLLTPVFRWIVAHISDSVLYGVILVVFLVHTLDTYLPLFGLNAHLSVFVDSFAGVFLLGYFLSAPHGEYAKSRRTENVFLACGVISWILSCLIILVWDDYGGYVYYNAPTMLFIASALFLGTKRATAGSDVTPYVVRLVGKYSYSILLIHWGVLHFVVKDVLGVDVLGGGIVGGCLLMIVLTFAISLAGAVVIDNTLIRLIQKLLDWIGRLFAQIVKRVGHRG